MMKVENIKTYPIFAINRHRILRDGDGITTLVGFGGCPLKCKYCINPGSSKILGFRLCTCAQIFNEVYVDNLYYLATGGGVTFGGGEPLLHPDCIVDFVNLCNVRWKINIETSFNVPMDAVKKVLRIVDEFVVDIKDMNQTIYHNYTGCSNERVIDNLKSGFDDQQYSYGYQQLLIQLRLMDHIQLHSRLHRVSHIRYCSFHCFFPAHAGFLIKIRLVFDMLPQFCANFFPYSLLAYLFFYLI